IGRHVRHRCWVHDGQSFEGNITHALPRLLLSLLYAAQSIPLLFPFIDDGWAINLCEAVNMGYIETCLAHVCKYRLGRRRCCRQELHTMLKLSLNFRASVE